MSAEVICAFGRLGAMFGCERLGYQPDMITMAKGLTSGYSPLGGVMIGDNEQLLVIVNDVVRAIPGVRATETFTYLHLEKQTYSWGTG